MINSLDFVVIGAQKCATTWLYDCLYDHPDLNMRESKNEDFYYGGEEFDKRGGEKWYFSQFKDGGSRLNGCVSVDYIEDENAPEKLFKLNPNIKIILLLRKPDSRAISAYQWYVRKSMIPDLPINEGLKVMLKHFSGEIKNEYSAAYCNIIERGFYHKGIARYLKYFPVDQIKIVTFDEVNANGIETYQSIASFLGIKADFIPAKIKTIPKKNSGFKPLIKLQRMFPKSRLVAKIVDLTNQRMSKSLKAKSSSSQLDTDLKNELSGVFSQANADLINLLTSVNDVKSAEKISKYWSL